MEVSAIDTDFGAHAVRLEIACKGLPQHRAARFGHDLPGIANLSLSQRLVRRQSVGAGRFLIIAAKSKGAARRKTADSTHPRPQNLIFGFC